MKIRYRPTALAQVQGIFDYIAERNRPAAFRVLRAIKQSIARLARFPNSGRQSEVSGIRELPVSRYPYIVFYTVDDRAREVLILRVRHASQDPRHHLG